jgi:hypothetical protein
VIAVAVLDHDGADLGGFSPSWRMPASMMCSACASLSIASISRMPSEVGMAHPAVAPAVASAR